MRKYDPEKLLEAWVNPPNECSVSVKAKGRNGSIHHVIQMFTAAPQMAADLIAARKTIATLTAERDALQAELTAIITNVTRGHRALRAARWAHLKAVNTHGSTISAEMVRAAGLDPNEVTGWNGYDPCPLCHSELPAEEE